MLVTLIGKKAIYRLTLPRFTMGNYWISEKNEKEDKKLLNIESKDGKWQVVSSKFVKIINPSYLQIDSKDNLKILQSNQTVIEKIFLKEYDMYCISIGSLNELYILYCSPVYEKDFCRLDIKHKTEIKIGNGVENDISYNNKLVGEKHAKLSYDNGRWILENFDLKFGTFVNDTPVAKTTRVLLNGDSIFILGLRIIIMGKSIIINNPNGKVKYNSETFNLNNERIEIPANVLEDEKEFFPEEEEYYSRSPRINNKIEHEVVKIDPPPSAQSKEEMPAFLMIGSTLSMGLIMMMSMGSSISGILNGTASPGEIIGSLLLTIVMLVSMIVFPLIEQKISKKAKVEYEEKRQKKYKEYINSKIKEIDEIMRKQKKILSDNYVSIEKCSNIILSKSPRLWERKIDDFDFLTLRLGKGDVPLDIDIQYPEKSFSLEEDNLVEILNTIVKKSKVMHNAPITMSLVENNIAGIISKDDEEQKRFVKNLLMQLITFQSYEDLKLVFLMKEDKMKRWEHLKMLPHVWDNAHQIRFFADNYDDMNEISTYLEGEFQQRIMSENANYKSFMPYYLIITDDYRKVESLKIFTEILSLKSNIGFSILCMADNLTQLPNECKTFVSIDKGNGKIFESEMTKKDQKSFTFDDKERLFFEKISPTIANIPIRYSVSSSEMLLPNSYGFLEMYDTGLIEQLNVLERWRKNDTTLSLRAPIGVDSSGMRIILDIHEKFHGPHGLIAGSTGSGKSEFIITYILSLAVNYHPDDLAFILIDYKGGGLAGAFQKREIKLPHLVGTITNIDTIGLQRSLASIQSELRRRQIKFNEARNLTDEGTIDIYKYQKLYHEGIVKEPIPHLLIICDEFAELKQQQEEFMDELISVARIGRSLGVHLILATQKPAGVVNDQIRSNSKFAVCLKVQDKEDSMDVIKKPDAANLKNTGRFYLQVGNDEYFTLGQSAWCGAPYFPSDMAKKKIDNSIEFISNIGTIIKRVDDSTQKIVDSQGEQLTNILKYIYELAKQENIKPKQLWLENIPETIFIEEVRKKYNVQNSNDDISPVVGEFDDPYNQRQGVVDLRLMKQGNTLIYGSADSGKETLLSTIVYDTITNYTTEDVEFYLLDFGSEALKVFKNAPHVGDVVFMDNSEKISRFFEMLQVEIKNRKEKLSDYNGNYSLYRETGPDVMPMIIVVINNFEAFSEVYGDTYEDMIQTMTREGVKCGIVFIMTVSSFNDVRYRLSQNFKQKIALQINNEDDYYNIFDNVGKKRPSHLFGRGLVSMVPGQVYEFQTAKICRPDKWNVHISETIEELKNEYKRIAKAIPVIPDRVMMEDVEEALEDLSTVPLGISKKDLRICTYDFTKNVVDIITAKNVDDAVSYVTHIVEELKLLENIKISLLDAERVILRNKNDLKNNYEELMLKLDDDEDEEINICVIIGLDKFINDLESEDEFSELLQKAEDYGRCYFIIVDSATRIKNHEYDDWYKKYLTGDTGIWVGNGVDEQYLISTNSIGKEIVNNCGISFGYLIKQGEATMMKLLGIKDGDEGE